MKIALIYPLLSKSRAVLDENKQFWPPLGLAYIAALLEKHGHRAIIIDRDMLLRKNKFDFERTDRLTLEEVNAFSADIVGISATTPNMFDVYQLARMLKQDNLSRKIILGGPHATAEPASTLEDCPDIDFIARGEGEFTMLELAAGKEPMKIDGLTLRDDKGKVINNPHRQLCPSLDDLPYPARHLLDMDFYTRSSRFIGRGHNLRTTSIFTARGCPYRCDFCAGHIMFPGKVRFHSASRIIGEMEQLVGKYGVEAVYIADDMFLASSERITAFLSLLRESRVLKGLKWIAQARANVINEPLLKSLKASGCVSLEYGFESGSQRMLELMHKGTTVEDNLRAARLTRKTGLSFTGFIISGYPQENESDFRKTVSFLKQARPTVIAMSLFYPLPGTAIYRKLVAEKQKIPAWDRIGDPEAAEVNYADMDKEKFERLYLRAKLFLVLPNNLYYFIRNNLGHPIGLIAALFTQFRGVFIRSYHALLRLSGLGKKPDSNQAGRKLRALFVSYNGLLEPILPSQGLPYLKELSKKGVDFCLLTFEKEQDLRRTGKDRLARMKNELKAQGIHWFWLRYHKKPPVFSTLFDIALAGVYSLYLILRYRINLVHLRGATLGPMMLVLRRILPVKFIFDMRGLLAEEYVGGGLWKEGCAAFKAVKWAERQLLKIADGVVILTEKHRALNKTLPYLKDRAIPMEVIPCCVDTQKFKNNGLSRKQAFVGESGQAETVFMYSGKIGTFYLIKEMLDFFQFVSERIPSGIMAVLTQDDEAPLLKAAQGMGIDPRKINIIRPAFDEIPAYLSTADYGFFFINPYKKFGSSPIKLGEFLSCGIPVIINPGIGDSEELVRNNRVGVVVEGFTPQSYARAMEELRQLKSEGEALSQRCRRVAQEQLSLGLAAERYWGIYQRVGDRLA